MTEGWCTDNMSGAEVYNLNGSVVIVDAKQFSEYTIKEAEDLACRILSEVQALKNASSSTKSETSGASTVEPVTNSSSAKSQGAPTQVGRPTKRR
jgi:hypothetical protein